MRQQILILYMTLQPLDTYPPCITQVLTLADGGYRVEVLTSNCGDGIKQLLAQHGVGCTCYPILHHPWRLLQRVMNFFHYGWTAFQFLRQHPGKERVIWLGTDETAMKFWLFVGRRHPVVVNALEFYEREDYQRAMARIAPRADILTACQSQRAAYMMDWWHLSARPVILPNRPYGHPRQRGLSGSTPESAQAIARLQGRRTVLYQGAIRDEREVVLLAKGMAAAGLDYQLALMGADVGGSVARIQEIYPNTVYLGRFPAPLHLEITSHACIGVAAYEDDCINNRYCAPNKIYEYTGFGIPVLCNTVPGLTQTIGAARAGLCVDFSRPEEVAGALAEMEREYDAYAANARRFFDAADHTEEILKIPEDALAMRQKT